MNILEIIMAVVNGILLLLIIVQRVVIVKQKKEIDNLMVKLAKAETELDKYRIR